MAVNQQTLEGNWNVIQGRLREKWGQLSQDDLQTAHGNVEQLVGMIQRRTGESREAVMDYLQELTSEGESQTASVTARATSAVKEATSAVKEYAQQATESLQGPARQAADTVRSGYEQTERMVRERPAESLAVCFGLGVVSGVLVGLMLRSR